MKKEDNKKVEELIKKRIDLAKHNKNNKKVTIEDSQLKDLEKNFNESSQYKKIK